MDAGTILIVDDDPQIRTMLRRYLAGEGYGTREADSEAGTHAALLGGDVTLVLLDLMLGGEDGLALARAIRARSDGPIIMLTGKDDVIDRVAGLEAGADDYIAKPFHLREVLARIRALKRRMTGRGTPEPAEPDPPEAVIRFDGHALDPLGRTLRGRDGADIPLTTAEFELLAVFLRHAGRVLDRDQLLNLLKGRDFEAFDRLVDTQVMRLRRKIEQDPGQPQLIKTVRGAGYIFAGKLER
ncbi:response regulator [Acidiphilium sp.]|uniref:response regulator n=1 Tax=Acidiphilium sp. TaxID=527 RepID=UPI002590F08D|nr:response regulator [Acidiphilium sp.]